MVLYRNNRVHFRNQLPHRDDLRWRGDGDVRVWASILDCANCRRTDGGVAQPIARANENAEWLQILWENIGRQIDAAFVLGEKEIGLGRFPAVVHPKPIFRRTANLLRDNLISFCSKGYNRVARRVETRRKDHLPAARALGVNGGGDKSGTGALRQ